MFETPNNVTLVAFANMYRSTVDTVDMSKPSIVQFAKYAQI